MTFEQMIEQAEAQARRVLVGTKEEMLPQWLLIDGLGNATIVGTPWANNEEKHLVTRSMRMIMREANTVAYTLVVETWFVRVTAEEMPGKQYKGKAPMDRPDRQEGVVIVGGHKDGRHVHQHWILKRDANGVCVELERLDGPEDQIGSAIFDNLLLEPGKPN